MPFFLRTIRKARWYNVEGVSWLEKGDIQADPLADLNTKGNELSVWLVENDRSNLEQVVTALAATRTDISNLDYALLDVRLLPELNIKVRHTTGGTPDEKANASWHRDLVELSAFKVVELARVILAKAERKRIPETEIRRLIIQAIASGRIEPTELQESIRDKIKG
jgi:hypothetical protein